jgi:sulfoxide reductase heme-binding subunit YedZ
MPQRLLVHAIALALGLYALRTEPQTVFGQPEPVVDPTLWFALLASAFLYLALLISAVFSAFPRMPGKRGCIAARRALGIDAAIFAGLHGWVGFTRWVGDLEGLAWWSWDYNLSLLLGTLAFVILMLLAGTSFDRAVAWLGPRWKPLHRLVYAAGVLTVAHVAIITIHIVNLRPWLIAWFVALAALLALEFVRLRHHVSRTQRRWVTSSFVLGVALLYWSTFLISHHRH